MKILYALIGLFFMIACLLGVVLIGVVSWDIFTEKMTHEALVCKLLFSTVVALSILLGLGTVARWKMRGRN